MVKKSQKSQNPIQEPVYWWKISLVLVLLLGVLATIWVRDMAIMSENRQEVVNVKQNYEIAKMQFCLDRGLFPCDKENLILWNDDNVGDKFEPVHGVDVNEIELKRTWMFK